MNLVGEENSAATEPPPSLRLVHDLAHARHALRDGRELYELAIRVARNDARQRRLAGPRRPPQHHRAHRAALDRVAQRLAWREQMPLADELVQRARTHAGREGVRRP